MSGKSDLDVGDLAYDTVAKSLGVVMAEHGTRYFLRPPRGGCEWDAPRENVVHVTTADRSPESAGATTEQLARRLAWVWNRVELIEPRAQVECVSGSPQCGAAPEGGRRLSVGAAEAWAEFHMRMTGHRRYGRVVEDVVQWEPPEESGREMLRG